MAGEIKASPRNQTLGKVADKLARLRDLANKYEILPQVPLLGGTGIGDLLMGQAPEEVSNWSYGNAPMQVPEMTRIPQMKTGRAAPVADALFLGADVGALGGLAASLGRRGLSEFVGSAGRMAAPGPVPQLGVIKPKGGNWEDLQVQRAVGNLKRPGLNDKGLENLRQRAGQGTLDRYMQENATNYALNSWIDKTLQKYVRNEMATPEDPVRLLAERGITHRPGGTDLNFDEFETLDWISDETEMARQLAGFPKEGMAKSPIAKAWENASDDVIWSRTAGELAGDLYPKAGLGEKTYLEAMPWLSKVDPNTPVYSAGNLGGEYLGFNHLLDELANATNPDSGLPADLLLKYESLPKVTVPQAVERVAKINEWRAKQKAEADAARAMNPATQVFKEYPDAGYKWVELKEPKDLPEGWRQLPSGDYEMPDGMITSKGFGERVLADALKYEGETMGHCVGGYCPDVIEGRSRIFSLRDAKGQPHVTVEVQPPGMRNDALFDAGIDFEGTAMRQVRLQNPGIDDESDDFMFAVTSRAQELAEEWNQKQAKIKQPRIVQIKGKANQAPKEEYLPFVQDFVKSQQWSDVGDLRNTGLIDLRDQPKRMEALGSRYVSEKELNDYLDSFGDKPQNFAQGGLVTPYDPARIEALVSQLMDEQ